MTENATSIYLQQTPPKYHSHQQMQKNALNYYRAVCRMFLIDFVCFNYSLPPECSDLSQEFQKDQIKFYSKGNRWKPFSRRRLHDILNWFRF
jgi:hypothetical protein